MPDALNQTHSIRQLLFLHNGFNRLIFQTVLCFIRHTSIIIIEKIFLYCICHIKHTPAIVYIIRKSCIQNAFIFCIFHIYFFKTLSKNGPACVFQHVKCNICRLPFLPTPYRTLIPCHLLLLLQPEPFHYYQPEMISFRLTALLSLRTLPLFQIFQQICL